MGSRGMDDTCARLRGASSKGLRSDTQRRQHLCTPLCGQARVLCVCAGPRGGEGTVSKYKVAEQDARHQDAAPFGSSCDSWPRSLAEVGGIHPGSPWRNTHPRPAGAEPTGRQDQREEAGEPGPSQQGQDTLPSEGWKQPWIRGHMGHQLQAELCPPPPGDAEALTRGPQNTASLGRGSLQVPRDGRENGALEKGAPVIR